MIHILQIQSQEYDNANDIADILKIKDFGSDTNDTIEENDSVRKKLPINISSLQSSTSHTRLILFYYYSIRSFRKPDCNFFFNWLFS